MSEPMDFEQAHFERPPGPSAQACALCNARLERDYWAAGGTIVCETCAQQLRSGPPKAGGFVRLIKAGALGTLFGLGGAIVYSAVLALTDTNLALLTILIGWLVGEGVRRGAEGRGGLGYQILAVALTYVLCMEAWAPMIYSGMTSGPDAVPPIAAVIIAPILSLAMPFFGEMSFLGFLILGFGMWRAFRALAVKPIVVDGPFQLGEAPAEVADASESGDPASDDPARSEEAQRAARDPAIGP